MKKTIEFKDLPVLAYSSGKYNLEITKAVVGEVIKNPEFDDGTDDCQGNDDHEFILSEAVTEDDVKYAFKNREPEWNNVKTIHFDETCTVPRYKLGHFCAQRNIKVTRSKDKADLVLYGKDFRNDLTEEQASWILTKSDFLKRAASLKSRIVPDLLLDTIKRCSSDVIAFDDIEWFMPKKGQIYGSYVVLTKPDDWNMLVGSFRYCNQDIILQEMGTETIDKFTYTRLVQMFESKDEENHRVAMEVMANCKYKSSIVYLLDLMRRFYGAPIFNMNDRGHVSFKALREYLDYEPKHDERSLNNMIYNIAHRDLLTEANYKIILELILEEEARRMGKNKDNDYDHDNWRVIQVDLSPKFKEMIIWDKQEEPAFVPVVGPVVVEKSEEGKPLTSVTLGILDLSKI